MTNPKSQITITQASRYAEFWNLACRQAGLKFGFCLSRHTRGNLFGICFLGFEICFAQSAKLDSLILTLQTATHDTTRINTLLSLADLYSRQNPDSAIYYATEAKNLARKLGDANQYCNALSELGWDYYVIGNYPRALTHYFTALTISEKLFPPLGGVRGASILGNIGNVYWSHGDYPKALDYYFRALKMAEGLNNKRGMAIRLGNIGIVYADQGDYPKALDYYFRALKMAEGLEDKNGIAAKLSNIGNVYRTIGDYPKALDYYLKALKINEESGNKNYVATNLGNIGSVYYYQSDYAKALDYYFRGLKMDEELGNNNGIAADLVNIGIVYSDQAKANANPDSASGLYNKALDYYLKALKIAEELGNKNGIAIALGNIGSLYTSIKEFNDAYNYLYRALALSDSIGAMEFTKNHYEKLSDLYEKADILLTDTTAGKLLNVEQMRLRSKYYYKRYIACKDSLFSEENKKQFIRKEMNYEFEKKEAAAKAEQEKKDAVAAADSRRQRLLLWLIVAVAVAVTVIAGVILRSLRITRKANEIIAKQKKLVDEKNKNIMDSIDYASRIQQAILMPEIQIKETLPKCFVFYKPKDVVSGDFYYVVTVNDWVVVAACDCTGHGVPGALMSMIGNSLLNEIVRDDSITNAGQVLDELNIRLIKALNPHGVETKVKDGMDVALMAWNKENGTVQFSGANRSILFICDGKTEEVPPARVGIGEAPEEKNQFPVHEIAWVAGITAYLCTDGFETQFGGPKNKKFKSGNLKELLLRISGKPMREQKELLEKTFDEWKGNGEQTDDITIIGIRI